MTSTSRHLLAATFAVAALVGAIAACHDAPAGPPPPAQSAQGPREVFAGKVGMNGNYLPEVAGNLSQRDLTAWTHAAEAAGSSDAATAELTIGQVGPGPWAVPIASCSFLPSAALTGSNTNFASITVWKRTPLADSSTTKTMIAQSATAIPPPGDAGVDAATGSWTIWTPVPIAVVAGAYVSPGDAITVQIDKTGTGTSVPQGRLACYATIQ
jgi:hypothetical protein